MRSGDRSENKRPAELRPEERNPEKRTPKERTAEITHEDSSSFSSVT